MVTMDLRVAWDTIEKALSIKAPQDMPEEEQMLEAAHVLEIRHLGHIIADWFFETFKQDLREQVAPPFWHRYQEAVPGRQVVSHVTASIRALYDHVAAYSACFEKLATIQTLMQPDVEGGHVVNVSTSRAHAQMLLKAIIFSKTTCHFQDAFHEFYNRAFKCFDTADLDDLDESSEEGEESLRCAGCEEDRDRCTCTAIRESFHTFNKQLYELGLLERLSGGPVSALIHYRIRHHVDHHCKGNFEASYLSQMEQWLDTKVVGWLELIYGTGITARKCPPTSPGVAHRAPQALSPILPHPEDGALDHSVGSPVATPRTPASPTLTASGTAASQSATATQTPVYAGSTPAVEGLCPASDSPVAAHKGRLHHYLYTVYADIRIDQLFNIIVEFPDSEPALLDLCMCLEKTDRRSKLVVMLKNALETRLLHPGVNTRDILTAYVSAIRALRVLDHTGVLLELVCEPVRKYLRSREDTVRRIVSDLTGDSGNELSEELIKGQPLVLDNSYHSDEDATNWEAWQPDPIDADPSRVSASRRSSDIISMLVNIYGSKELFVNEYRTLLADRLLAHFHSATEREIRNLELLKLRFGEQQLHYCEVMLKDVADSKRINTHIMEHQLREARRELNKGTKSTLQCENQHPVMIATGLLQARPAPAEITPVVRAGSGGGALNAPVVTPLRDAESGPATLETPTMETPTHALELSNMETPTDAVETPSLALQAVETPSQVTETSLQAMETPIIESSTHVMETSAQSVQTPSQSVQTPPQRVQTPSQRVQTPSQSVQTPSQSVQMLSQAMVTTSQVMETPLQAMEMPSQTMETPSPSMGRPSQSVQTPLQAVQSTAHAFETPSHVLETPAISMEAPTPGTSTTSTASSIAEAPKAHNPNLSQPGSGSSATGTPLQMRADEKAAKEKASDTADQKQPLPATAVKKEDDIPVTAMILSAQFWPTFREEKLQLPDIMQRALDTYTKGYETLKGNRTLCWKNHLGLVNVEIELKDGRKLDINVSPVHATIIWHFEHKSRWTVEELSAVMHMPASGVRRKMALWQSHGLLREETTDTFVLSEDARSRSNADVIMDEDEAESAMASASDQREEELQVLWSYIVGMLTNLESLPLERIHSMLKMFMMQSPTSTEVSLPELKGYLDRQVKDQKLLYSAGVYRLPKPGS